MSIKQYGGVFGRNPTFNKVTADSVETNLLTVDRLSTDGTLIAFEKNGVSVGAVGTRSNLLTIGTDDVGLLFNSSSNAIRPESISGGTTSDALIDLGQTTSRFKDVHLSGNVIVASGKGIDFSATSGTGTSELFDDYEEGTWTPVPADAASGGNTSSATKQIGLYTKIGNIVQISGVLINIDTSGLTAGNTLYVQGLPFQSADFTATAGYYIGGVFTSQTTIGSNLVMRVLDLESAFSLIDDDGAILVSDLNTGAADINFSLTYHT
jgi:hypothetical protein